MSEMKESMAEKATALKDQAAEKLGEFINDKIVRSLAGVTGAGRPVFLKIVYHGPRAMEELTQRKSPRDNWR